MASPIVEAHGLTKRFGKVDALAGLDLVAHSGQVVAVLGPNGAGKTTFVRTIATLVRPDAGSLRVDGIDVARRPEQVRRIIGLAGQYAAVEEAMTGRENLDMVARLFGHDRRAARANSRRRARAAGADRTPPTGWFARTRVACGAGSTSAPASSGAPRLLLLDEPTTGLDPRSRIDLWDAIRALVAHGTDVLLTTQYLDEADQLASQVVIIDRGRVIAEGTPSELKSRAGRDVIEVHAHRADDLGGLAGALAPIGTEAPRLDPATRRVTVPVVGGRRAINDAVRALDVLGVDVDDIALRRPTLDEVFLVLTGAPIDAPSADTDIDDDPHAPAVPAGAA